MAVCAPPCMLYVAKKIWGNKTELIYIAGYVHLALAERVRQDVKIPIAILGGAVH